MFKNNILAYIAAIITAIIFGLSFLFSKSALNLTDPFSLLSFRFLTALIVMFVLILFRVIKVNFKGKNLSRLFFLSLFQPITYFIFESFGIKYSSSSIAGIMISLIPIAVALMSTIIIKEVPSKSQFCFILLSVMGVILIVLFSENGNVGTSTKGVLFLIGAVISASAFNVFSRKFSIHFTPAEMTFSMVLIGTIFFNAISIYIHIKNGNLYNYLSPIKNTSFLISILYLGILSSIVAFLLTNYTLSKIEASETAVFANLTTIVSVLAGVVIFKESLHLYQIIGSLIIILGIWGTNNFSPYITNLKKL